MSRRLKIPRIESLDLRAGGDDEYPWVWTRSALPPSRKGHACKKVAPNERDVARRTNGMARIEFRDGSRFVVDPRGLKKRQGGT